MIRYAIWAAVSSPEQARPDKISLQVQTDRCRAAAQTRGWQEAAGPYIADGYSRSFYMDLTLARNTIPALNKLLMDAHSGQFDVLVFYSYDRLGDLANPMAMALRWDNVQLYSVLQAVEPQPPETYDPYENEAEGIMRDAHAITQRFRINDLRRKWRQKMPERVRRGLQTTRIPYGYIHTSSDRPPALNPVEAAVVIRIKDEFLAGGSFRGIAQRLTIDRLPTSSGSGAWSPTSVRDMLRNEYYSGVIALGKTHTTHDAAAQNRSRRIDQPRSRWQIAQGGHEPLWDQATQQAIQSEMRSRNEHNKRFNARFPFSGLLFCAECGNSIFRNWHNGPICKLTCKKGRQHFLMDYDAGFDLVAAELTRAVFSRALNPEPATVTETSDSTDRAVAALGVRRKRIQNGYEAGLYTQLEAAEKLAQLDSQVEALQSQQRQADQSARSWSEWRALLSDQSILQEHFPAWLRSDNPALVNRLLMAIIDKILISHDHRVEIVWRG